MNRSRPLIAITAWLIAALACPPALAASSSASAYGGDGIGITPIAPHSPDGTLPFTGLDLGLVFGAALILIAAGVLVRWQLQRSGHGGRSA
jgi:hypothetical protein